MSSHSGKETKWGPPDTSHLISEAAERSRQGSATGCDEDLGTSWAGGWS